MPYFSHITQSIIAISVAVLAADALYDRFVRHGVQFVQVRGGYLDAEVSGTVEIDTSSQGLRVYVDGGELTLPTDPRGRLYVVPVAEACAGIVC